MERSLIESLDLIDEMCGFFKWYSTMVSIVNGDCDDTYLVCYDIEKDKWNFKKTKGKVCPQALYIRSSNKEYLDQQLEKLNSFTSDESQVLIERLNKGER